MKARKSHALIVSMQSGQQTHVTTQFGRLDARKMNVAGQEDLAITATALPAKNEYYSMLIS